MLAIALASLAQCESHCDNPCAELNGNVEHECLSCSSTVRCHNGASGWHSRAPPANIVIVAAEVSPLGGVKSQQQCDVPGGTVNVECRRERHRREYGEYRLPRQTATGNMSIASSNPNGSAANATTVFAELPLKAVRPIFEVDGCLSIEAFLTQHVYQLQPVVMRNCAEEVLSPSSRWDDAYLKAKAGSSYGNRDLKADGRTFADFIAAANAAERQGSDAAELQYLPRHVPPSIWTDLRAPRFLRCAALVRRVRALHMRYTGRRRVVNGLHFDAADGFGIQLDGKKTWTLVDTADSVSLYSDHIYPLGGGPELGYSVFTRRGGTIDLDELPELCDTPTQSTVLGAGDVLFIPRRWWHEIDNHPGRNVALVMQVDFPPPATVTELPPAEQESFFSAHLAAYAHAWRSTTTQQVDGRGAPSSNRTAAPAGSNAAAFPRRVALDALPPEMRQCVMDERSAERLIGDTATHDLEALLHETFRNDGKETFDEYLLD